MRADWLSHVVANNESLRDGGLSDLLSAVRAFGIDARRYQLQHRDLHRQGAPFSALAALTRQSLLPSFAGNVVGAMLIGGPFTLWYLGDVVSGTKTDV